MSKKVFVTGSSRGIGRGIALEFAKAGYDVGVNYNTYPDGAEEVVKMIEDMGQHAIAIKGNISKFEDIDRMFEEFLAEFGHIDVMVNNAGITRSMPFIEVTPEHFYEVIETDMKGTYFCAQKAARDMIKNNIHGVIINISSNHQKAVFGFSTVYAMGKAALAKFAQNAAIELAPYGIRMVDLAPGMTEVGKSDLSPARAEHKKLLESRLPTGRYVEPDEIGAAAVFLASDGARSITGTTLMVDGAATLEASAFRFYNGENAAISAKIAEELKTK